MDLTLPSPCIPSLSTCLCFPSRRASFTVLMRSYPVSLNCTVCVPFICFGEIAKCSSFVCSLAHNLPVGQSLQTYSVQPNVVESQTLFLNIPHTVSDFGKMCLKKCTRHLENYHLMEKCSHKKYAQWSFNISLSVNIIKLQRRVEQADIPHRHRGK